MQEALIPHAFHGVCVSRLDILAQKHRLLSIVFYSDRIYTRPERVMVLLVWVLYLLALNCFLFILAGSAQAAPASQRFSQQFVYMLISTALQAPMLAIVVLLFKRSAPARPPLEDRWLDAGRYICDFWSCFRQLICFDGQISSEPYRRDCESQTACSKG